MIEYGLRREEALEEVVVGLAVLVGAPELGADAGQIRHSAQPRHVGSSLSTVEQPFHTDLGYYEGRADGIATVERSHASTRRGSTSRAATGSRAGTSSIATSRRSATAASRRRRSCSPTAPSRPTTATASSSSSTRIPSSSTRAARTATTCSGWPATLELVRLLLERGADPNRGNDYGWTKLHQAGYSNRPELAQLMLDAGGRLDLSARGDGGTPLIAALFWGHREVAPLLGLEPGNLRVAAGLGASGADRELAGTPARGSPPRLLPARTAAFPPGSPRTIRRRCSTRRSSGPRRATASRCSALLVELGARVDADPYRGTALIWAAVNGRVASIREARRARRRPEPARHLRRPRPRRGRDGAPPRRPGRAARGGRGAARARRRPDDRRRAATTARRRAGPSFGGHAELAARLRDLAG